MLADGGYPVWLTVLASTVIGLAITAGVWFGIRRILAARRIQGPRLRSAWLVSDHIDLVFSDGSARSLPLHAPDLRLETVAGSWTVAVNQTVLVGTGHDGRPVPVVIHHTRRGAITVPPTRQPDQVLAAIAAVAESSPYPAGRLAAQDLRRFIGSRDSGY